MVCRTVTLALLVVAAPLFANSPEILVGDTASTSAPYLRGPTAVDTDGTDFFVAWSDNRSGDTTESIIGTRVTRSGQVLDPLGIHIDSARGDSYTRGAIRTPQVVWDGSAYLVVWTALNHDSWSGMDVHAARIDRDGKVVMAPRVIVEHAMTTAGRYAGSNGTVTIVAYLSFESGPDYPARVVVLDENGYVMRHESLASNISWYNAGISVAVTPSQFVLAWSTNPGSYSAEDADIFAVALTAAGHLSGAPKHVGEGEKPVIATDGMRFVIAAQKTTNRQQSLWSRAFNAKLSPVGYQHDLSSAIQSESMSLLWRGDSYELLVGSRDLPLSEYYIASLELDAGGRQRASRSRGVLQQHWTYESPAPVAVTNGADVMVAFSKNTPPAQSQQIIGRVYRGSSLDPDVHELLSWSGNTHVEPQVATSASGRFVAWAEEGGIYGTRIDKQGNSLDGRGLRIGTNRGRMRVAFDGTNYVVAWVDSGTQIGVRYIAPSTSATVADLRVSAANVWQGLALAVSPEATYLVYADARINVTRIPHATHVADPVPLAVSPEDMGVDNPAAAWNGSSLLIAWNEIYYPPNVSPPIAIAIKIHAARVSGGLSLLDPSPLLVSSVSDDDGWGSHSAPSVASNGADWLIVADVNATDLIARRVSRNGLVEANAPAKIGVGIGPVVTWDGARYAVAWKEGSPNADKHQLVMAGVPPSGALVAMRRTLAATDVSRGMPSLARDGDDVAVAYLKVSFLPQHTGVERSFFRTIDVGVLRGRPVRR
jgi:hypothetical protein